MSVNYADIVFFFCFFFVISISFLGKSDIIKVVYYLGRGKENYEMAILSKTAA